MASRRTTTTKRRRPTVALNASRRRPMTIEERGQKCKDLYGAVTATLGYIDLIQNPEPGQLGKDECLNKAHLQADRAREMVIELLRDALQK
jgi:hypothetical protein